jgi:hypothetical protein
MLPLKPLNLTTGIAGGFCFLHEKETFAKQKFLFMLPKSD